MKSIETKAFAKINLTLDVLGKMDNNYHEMLMIMQSVDLCDDITIAVDDGGSGITAITDKSYLPRDMNNLACKAAKEFLSAAGISNAGVKINIRKRIPVCAGLGGGSSDAAAVIRGLNELLGTGFSTATLETVSQLVGSDVAFCVSGGTVLASGRGDQLRRIDDMPDCCVLICKPKFSVSTPELFSKIDSFRIKYHPDTEGALSALRAGKLQDIARRCYNVFENVLPTREKGVVDSIKDAMLTYGALGACMTGTGSAVYGIFTIKSDAEQAKEALLSEHNECFLAKTVKKVL